jgi:hypothetical protein
LKKQKDRFANPVGYTLSTEEGHLFEELLLGVDTGRVSPILDRMIRIRAIQDFNPAPAVAFIFLLKRVLREVLEKELRESHISHELRVFESRIDELILLAFDIYMNCREKIYEIRANEARNQVSRLLQKAGLISEIPEWKENLKKGNTP